MMQISKRISGQEKPDIPDRPSIPDRSDIPDRTNMPDRSDMPDMLDTPDKIRPNGQDSKNGSRNERRKKQAKTVLSILKLLMLLAIIAGIPIAIYRMDPAFINEFRDLDTINAFLDRYAGIGGLVFIGLQILQIIVSVIPGQMIQLATGYAYIFWLAYLISIIGIGLGTILTFYLARFLGTDAMHVIFGEERITYFVNHLNSKKAYITLFILFLIPGFPKDLITYAAGVSEIRVLPFLILNLLGRTPALAVTILMGGMARTGSYTGMILLAVAVSILFLLCIVKRREIIAVSDSIYDKLSQPGKKGAQR